MEKEFTEFTSYVKTLKTGLREELLTSSLTYIEALNKLKEFEQLFLESNDLDVAICIGLIQGIIQSVRTEILEIARNQIINS